MISAAFELTRSSGISAVTARELGQRLGCSTRPLFTFFDTIEELRSEVVKKATELYLEGMKEISSSDEPFYSLGRLHLDFIENEPKLWELIFSDPKLCIELFEELASELASAADSIGLDRESASCFAKQLLIFANGLAPYIMFEKMSRTDAASNESIRSKEVKESAELKFERGYLALFKAFKEISGFAAGSLDRAELVKKLSAPETFAERRTSYSRQSRSSSFESWID